MQNLELDEKRKATDRLGMTPQKKRPALRMPQVKLDPLNLPNMKLIAKSELPLPRPPPFSTHSSLYTLPRFTSWEEALEWFGSELGLAELAIKEIEELYGNLTAIIFLKDAVVDQHESATEIQIDLMHGLLDLFGSDHISYKPDKSYNSPRMVITFGQKWRHMFLDAFIWIDEQFNVYHMSETQIKINDDVTLKLTIFDQRIDKDLGFDPKNLATLSTFKQVDPDFCINIQKLPPIYSGRNQIGPKLEKLIPGIKVVQRSKAIIFNKAQQSHIQDINTPIFIPHADSTAIMEANGCQVWVTHTSMTQVLTSIYVDGTTQWPETLNFNNNDGTPDWKCPFSFQQREEYVLAGGVKMKICGNCKGIDCNYKDPKCPMNKIKRDENVTAYLKKKDERKRKIATQFEEANKNMILVKSRNKSRFKK